MCFYSLFKYNIQILSYRKMILNREVLIFICLTPEEENHENYRKKEMQRNSRGH